MRKIIKILIILVFSIVILVGSFILYSTVTDFQPDEEIIIMQTDDYSQVVDSSFTVLTWNIGYAGLGADMDFFYAGGLQVRTSKAQTDENLKQIMKVLLAQKNVDFFLLQEVDVKAKRTYYTNESDMIKESMPDYSTTYADNYLVNYIPVPLSEPLGRVKSGLQTSSKLIPYASTRYSYPGNFDWPERVFMLDRGFIVNRYKLKEGNELLIINTHNSAFDDGSIKKQQINYLVTFLKAEIEKGNLFVVGGDWNQNPPNFDQSKIGFRDYDGEKFILSAIDDELFPDTWNWNFDDTIGTSRSTNKAYQKDMTWTTVLDFFLTSPGLKVKKVNAIDLDFQNSDHQPVIMSFEIE